MRHERQEENATSGKGENNKLGKKRKGTVMEIQGR